MPFDNKARAKELFFHYAGSHYQMWREGEYSEYEKYNITKEQEHEWAKELQDNLISKIKKDKIVKFEFTKLCMSIEHYHSLNSLKELVEVLIEKKHELDTFSILLIAESILSIVEYFDKYKKLRNHRITFYAKTTSLNILRWLLEQPITIADEYFEKVTLFPLNEEAITDRIKEELNKWCS